MTLATRSSDVTVRHARFMEGLKRFVTTQPVGVVAAAGIIILLLAALFAPWIAPHDPVEQNRQAFMEGPSSQFWFGTDDLGRDIFSRIIHGARISLYVSTTVTLDSILGEALARVRLTHRNRLVTVRSRSADLEQPGVE